MSVPTVTRGPGASRRTRIRAIRRRRLLAALAVLVLIGSLGLAERGGGPAVGHASSATLSLRWEGRTLAQFAVREPRRPGDAAAIRRQVLAALPTSTVVRHGAARISFRVDRAATATRAGQLARGGTVPVIARPVSASVAAPVIPQRLHNDCEAAALQILLATIGDNVDQVRLLGLIPRSTPLDPQGTPANRIWGDPDEGFVGRPAGGGPAGGFGVYQRPIARVAQRLGVRLQGLAGASASAIYARLLTGHAVMAWVGLANGPFGSWRTPTGKFIQVNFNEHTIVLTGILPNGKLQVVNPLRGTAETWTKPQFESMWALLGKRALST